MYQETNNSSEQERTEEELPEVEPQEELPEVEPQEELPEVEPQEELPEVEPQEELPETEPQKGHSEEEPKEAEAAEDPSGEDPSKNGQNHKKKGKLFGKKDSKDEKIEELQDRLARQMAEFDNFRKRTEKEKASMYDVGAREIIEKILPIVDNFERGISAIPEDEKETPFAEGMVMIYKQLTKMLEDAGVEVIEAEGKTFDPQLHNAVMHIDDDSYGENVVSQELQKGYKYHGTVIRHSLVQVAN